MAKIAYSYIRFSTKKQVTDASIAVQLERAREYAEEHGYDLQEKSYKDLGLSGFTNENVKNGALGKFLEAVQDGPNRKIPRGSTLIIENLDRISRANPWDALPVFMGIINSGITVITLVDKQVYTRKDTTSTTDQMTIFASLTDVPSVCGVVVFRFEPLACRNGTRAIERMFVCSDSDCQCATFRSARSPSTGFP